LTNNITKPDLGHNFQVLQKVALQKKKRDTLKKSIVPVTGLMTYHPYTLNITDTLDDARETFGRLRIRHLPLVNGEELVGILSLTDILRLSFGENFGAGQYEADTAIFKMLTIDQVMKHKPLRFSPVIL